MSKYVGRSDDMVSQIADLMKRVAILETGRAPSNVNFGAVTEAEYTTPSVTITSGSFTVAYRLWPNATRRGIETYMRVVTPVGVTMEVKLVDTVGPTDISPTATVPASTNGLLGLRGLTSNSYTSYSIQVQARVASGAGTCRVGLLRAVAGDYQAGTF